MTHLKATSFSDYAKKKAAEEKGALNEEQEAQARKEAGGFYHPIYECHPIDQPQKKIFVESERWFDARAFAIRRLGVPEVRAIRVDVRELPRFQIRWVGTAASGTTNQLRMQWRNVTDPNQVAMANTGWKDV